MSTPQSLPLHDLISDGTNVLPFSDPAFLDAARRLASLLGPGAGNAPDGSELSCFLRGVGGGVATANATVQRAFAQAFPNEATDLLSELEAQWGLPDGSGRATALRQTGLLAKIRAGIDGTPQNIAATVALVAGSASVVENTAAAVAATNPRGVFVFAVVVPLAVVEDAPTQSTMQALVEQMKPAHTLGNVTNHAGFYCDDPASLTDLTVLGH